MVSSPFFRTRQIIWRPKGGGGLPESGLNANSGTSYIASLGAGAGGTIGFAGSITVPVGSKSFAIADPTGAGTPFAILGDGGSAELIPCYAAAVRLVRIRAGAFGVGIPSRELRAAAPRGREGGTGEGPAAGAGVDGGS